MNLLPKCRLLSALSLLLALLTVAGMPAAVAQEGQSSASASQQEEEIARLNELLDQARAERIDKIRPEPTRAIFLSSGCLFIDTRSWKTD
jgi:hypothetical protein